MVIVGGEEILPERFVMWQQFAGHQSDLVHVFGLTETSVTSLTYHFKGEEANSEGSAALPIGRPLANTEIYVLDKRFEPVPIGIVGELYIGGSGLARGYLTHTDLTAETFLPHPFSEQKGARLYKTGDFVRYLPDKNLEFVGRVDEQVKLRGFRIELGEIAAIVSEHPAVRDAVVVVKKIATTDSRLIAYLVSEGEVPLNAAQIRLFLRAKLPEQMIPNAYVQLKELPLTLNGKVDRHRLPAPDLTQMESSLSFIAPQTRFEQDIAIIWQEVLQVEKVGRHDNFFDLGGHSLLLMQVYRRISDQLKKELSFVEMFNHPTVHALAKLLGDATDEDEFVRQGAASKDKLMNGKNRLRHQFKQLQHQKVELEREQRD
jgi:aryl carrier-like protein